MAVSVFQTLANLKGTWACDEKEIIWSLDHLDKKPDNSVNDYCGPILEQVKQRGWNDLATSEVRLGQWYVSRRFRNYFHLAEDNLAKAIDEYVPEYKKPFLAMGRSYHLIALNSLRVGRALSQYNHLPQYDELMREVIELNRQIYLETEAPNKGQLLFNLEETMRNASKKNDFISAAAARDKIRGILEAEDLANQILAMVEDLSPEDKR